MTRLVTDSFHTGVIRGRCTVNIVLGAMLTTASILLSLKLIPTLPSFWAEFQSVMPRIFAVGLIVILFLVLAAGCRLLWAFLSNEERITKVTELGICSRNSVVLWANVARIGRARISKKIELWYQVKGGGGIRLIPSDEGLTELEYNALRKYIGEQYPEISIGEE